MASIVKTLMNVPTRQVLATFMPFVPITSVRTNVLVMRVMKEMDSSVKTSTSANSTFVLHTHVVSIWTERMNVLVALVSLEMVWWNVWM